MMRDLIACLVILAFGGPSTGGTAIVPPQGGVSITFLANEGVLLSSGDKQVLIDALFQKYETGYAIPADSTRAARRLATPESSDQLVGIITEHPIDA